MVTGKVKWFSDAKGYGFIESGNEVDNGKDIFVHYSEITKGGYKTLAQGQTVEFELSDSPRGLQARNVSVVN